MTIQGLKALLTHHTDIIRDKVQDTMPWDGDTEELSQWVQVLNRVRNLQDAINGIGDSDLKTTNK